MEVVERKRATLLVSPVRLTYWVLPGVILGVYCLVLVSDTVRMGLSAWLDPSVSRFVDEVILIGLGVLVFGASLITSRLLLSQVYLWLLAFSVLVLANSYFRGVPTNIIVSGYMLIIKPYLIFLIFQSLPLNATASRRIIRYLEVLLCVVVIVSVIYAVLFDQVLAMNFLPGELPGQRRIGLVPSRSFFIHPSPFSSVMTLTGFYFFARLLNGFTRRDAALFLLSCLGVFLSLRLKALFLFPSGIVIIYFLNKMEGMRIRVRSLVTLAGLMLLVGAVILVLAFLVQDLLIQRIEGGILTVRAALMVYAFDINQDTVGLGAGLGMFGSSVSVTNHYSPLYHLSGISKLYGGTPNNPSFITDQWWAWYLGEAGAVGMILFLGFLFAVVVKLSRIATLPRNGNLGVRILAQTAVASLLYGILSGYAGVYLTAPPTGFLIMSFAGLTLAVKRGLEGSNGKRVMPSQIEDA